MSREEFMYLVISFLCLRGMWITRLSIRWMGLAHAALSARIDSGRYSGEGFKQWSDDLALLGAVSTLHCLPRLWIWTVNSAISHLPRAVELRDEAIQLARIKAACR